MSTSIKNVIKKYASSAAKVVILDWEGSSYDNDSFLRDAKAIQDVLPSTVYVATYDTYALISDTKPRGPVSVSFRSGGVWVGEAEGTSLSDAYAKLGDGGRTYPALDRLKWTRHRNVLSFAKKMIREEERREQEWSPPKRSREERREQREFNALVKEHLYTDGRASIPDAQDAVSEAERKVEEFHTVLGREAPGNWYAETFIKQPPGHKQDTVNRVAFFLWTGGGEVVRGMGGHHWKEFKKFQRAVG